jgi:ankyrin repeat protein/mono/diheme cytochrome c family protein
MPLQPWPVPRRLGVVPTILRLLAACSGLAPGASAASELHRALHTSDPRWRALLADASVDQRDADGNTPLHLAALRENAAAVAALLERGANADATNRARATPLHYGAGSEPIVRALLKYGANPNAVSAAGMSPLLAAALHASSHAVVRLLVDAGADVNAIIPETKTGVLALAVTGGDVATVQFLLDRGANPNGGDGNLPLVAAAYTGDLAVLRLLLDRGAHLDSANPFFGHALHATFFTGHERAAALLIERGANPRLKSGWGHGTPPMVFSAYNESGSPTIARLLHARGVDLDSANDLGETALSYALKRGPDTPLVRFLLEAGATPPAAPLRRKTVPQRPLPAAEPERLALLRTGAQRAIDVLQRGSRGFLENKFVRDQKCISCHQQTLPAAAFGLARERGLRVDEAELGRQLHAQMAIMWAPNAEAARQMREPFPVVPDSAGFGADALAALHYAADASTDAIVHFLLRLQRTSGEWIAERRPPMQDGALSATAWAVRAIQLFPPPGERERVADSLRRARTWLARQSPVTHNERVFQLLGLAWSGESPSRLASFTSRLLATQRPGGGWSQLPALDPDAWATGSALVALHKAGVAPTHPAFRRGVDFLLRTQFDDGSWWVRSRTWPFQPHFDGQFPHGKDQWISAGGTAWATMALLLTLEPTTPTSALADGQTLVARFLADQPAVATPPATAAPASAFTPSTRPGAANAAVVVPDFARDIQPLFERSCAGCHAGEKVRGGFDLGSRAALLKGGNSGDPAVVPGRSHASFLVRYIADEIEDLEMPPLNRREKYPALSPDEVARLRAWIDAGAVWSDAR